MKKKPERETAQRVAEAARDLATAWQQYVASGADEDYEEFTRAWQPVNEALADYERVR